jgi:hypothetical protein
MVALLSGGRLGEPAEKSVDDGAHLDQIAHRAKPVAVLSLFRRVDAAGARPVGPGGRNEGSATVGQRHQHQRHAAPDQAVDHRKAASLERMPSACDHH